jgi:hypothetical protein
MTPVDFVTLFLVVVVALAVYSGCIYLAAEIYWEGSDRRKRIFGSLAFLTLCVLLAVSAYQFGYVLEPVPGMEIGWWRVPFMILGGLMFVSCFALVPVAFYILGGIVAVGLTGNILIDCLGYVVEKLP